MKTAKLRPHHIFCERFLPLDDLGRGDAFARAIRNMKAMLESEDRVLIAVTEGVDDLCQDCPDRAGDRCENANGNEEKVRKWDGRIAAGLGIAYGERRSAAEFRELILAKAPLDFCRERCPWKMFCSVFGIP